jgi:hypothetical protein
VVWQITGLRLLVGFLWLWNVSWKVPPDFGEDKRTGLYFWTHLGLDFPVFPPHTWLLEHVVLPNFTAFGWSLNYRLPPEVRQSNYVWPRP